MHPFKLYGKRGTEESGRPPVETDSSGIAKHASSTCTGDQRASKTRDGLLHALLTFGGDFRGRR